MNNCMQIVSPFIITLFCAFPRHSLSAMQQASHMGQQATESTPLVQDPQASAFSIPDIDITPYDNLLLAAQYGDNTLLQQAVSARIDLNVVFTEYQLTALGVACNALCEKINNAEELLQFTHVITFLAVHTGPPTTDQDWESRDKLIKLLNNNVNLEVLKWTLLQSFLPFEQRVYATINPKKQSCCWCF
jgi:hypothetical protein